MEPSGAPAGKNAAPAPQPVSDEVSSARTASERVVFIGGSTPDEDGGCGLGEAGATLRGNWPARKSFPSRADLQRKEGSADEDVAVPEPSPENLAERVSPQSKL